MVTSLPGTVLLESNSSIFICGRWLCSLPRLCVMSRCFPFPPPGYEKKVPTENVDLLRKDKHKEKKHRKEKREKEKREGAEKKEKDRGDGKHREKKDRKDKHRDKTKDRGKEKKKEKDKHEDKKSASGEKRVADQLKGYKGQNVGEIPDSNKLKSLTEEKVGENRVERTKDSKVAPEVGGKIHNDNRIGNQLAEKWENGGTFRSVTNSVGSWAKGMDKTNEKRESDRQLHRPGLDYKGTPVQRNPVVQNVPRAIQNSLEEVLRTKENTENRVEGKEMGKEKEGDGHKGDRQKEKDREKKSQEKGQNKAKEKSRGKDKKKSGAKDEDKDKKKSGGKDEDKDNEKRKSKTVNQTDESWSTENDRVRNSNKKILSYAEDVHPLHHPLHLPKDGGSSSAERKIAKREEVEANGLHGNDNRPNKLPMAAPIHPSTENGAKSAHFSARTPPASNYEGLMHMHSQALDNKGKRKNGIIEAQPSSIPLHSATPAITQEAVRVAPPSAKPPHPDSKYLSQLLSVPKVEEWRCTADDDEDWLFSSNSGSQSKKPRMGSSGADDEAKHVWSEALWIESADVYALPYVIPY